MDVRAALSRLRRASGLPVAFGGLLAGHGRYRINRAGRTATTVLRGLAIRQGNGLGGKAVALSRPLAVTDYRVSPAISHEYDTAVAAEGLRSVLAVPVVVRRRVRGVLYGALRTPSTARRPAAVARRWRRPGTWNRRSLLQDEAARLLSLTRQPTAADPAMVGGGTGGARRAARAGAADHRPAAAGGDAGGVRPARGGLVTAARRRRGGPSPVTPREGRPGLRRVGRDERGGGGTAGAGPGDGEELSAVRMRKLGAHTRLQAVSAARRAGALP